MSESITVEHAVSALRAEELQEALGAQIDKTARSRVRVLQLEAEVETLRLQIADLVKQAEGDEDPAEGPDDH